MKRRFQGVLDFDNDNNSMNIRSKINETILATVILKMGREVINLTGCKVNIYIVSKDDKREVLYSSSKVKVISPLRGLISFELPGYTFQHGSYKAEIEIIDSESKNFLSCSGITFDITGTLNDKKVEYLAEREKIETLLQLDAYIKQALESLNQYREKMEEIENA